MEQHPKEAMGSNMGTSLAQAAAKGWLTALKAQREQQEHCPKELGQKRTMQTAAGSALPDIPGRCTTSSAGLMEPGLPEAAEEKAVKGRTEFAQPSIARDTGMRLILNPIPDRAGCGVLDIEATMTRYDWLPCLPSWEPAGIQIRRNMDRFQIFMNGLASLDSDAHHRFGWLPITKHSKKVKLGLTVDMGDMDSPVVGCGYSPCRICDTFPDTFTFGWHGPWTCGTPTLNMKDPAECGRSWSCNSCLLLKVILKRVVYRWEEACASKTPFAAQLTQGHLSFTRRTGPIPPPAKGNQIISISSASEEELLPESPATRRGDSEKPGHEDEEEEPSDDEQPCSKMCVFCNKPWGEYGHGAHPLSQGKCCNACFYDKVLVAKLIAAGIPNPQAVARAAAAAEQCSEPLDEDLLESEDGEEKVKGEEEMMRIGHQGEYEAAMAAFKARMPCPKESTC
jgi:hypothetical protein